MAAANSVVQTVTSTIAAQPGATMSMALVLTVVRRDGERAIVIQVKYIKNDTL